MYILYASQHFLTFQKRKTQIKAPVREKTIKNYNLFLKGEKNKDLQEIASAGLEEVSICFHLLIIPVFSTIYIKRSI